MPKVSILLTSYNHEKYIAKAIESALNQTFTDFELFIVDDCSSDSSWEIIKSYNDPRITAVRNEKNIRNMIYNNLHRFSGEYVAIHHSDDVWESDKLQKQVDYMDAHPGTLACFTHVQFIDENSVNYTPPESHPYYKIFDQPNRTSFEWLRFFMEKGNALCHPSILIRKEAYKKFNLLSCGLFQIPDFLMWIRVCLVGEIHILQEKLTKFRLHVTSEGNVSGDKLSTRIRDAAEVFLICNDYFNIIDKGLFYNVFPEYVPQNVVPDFVLARELIETGYQPKQLCGLNRIFKLINIPDTAQKIKELHNYTYKDFTEDTKKYDVFSIEKHVSFLTSTLFFDKGDGFNVTNSLSESVYVRASGAFQIKFTLPEQTEVQALRFDPDENRYWDISIDSVVINGIRQQATALNSISKTDEYDSFLTVDPRYSLTAPSHVKEVEIAGKIRPTSCSSDELFYENKHLNEENINLKTYVDDLTQHCDGLIQQRDDLTQQRDGLTQHCDNLTRYRDELIQHRDNLIQQRDDLTQQRDNLTQQRDALVRNYNAIINSTSWKITKPLRAMMRLIRRLIRG